MIGRYRAAYPGLVFRLLFSPRWIMWHLLTLGAMITCGLLSAWQWGRAESATGSLLNVGYSIGNDSYSSPSNNNRLLFIYYGITF